MLATGDYLIVNKYSKKALDAHVEEAMQENKLQPRPFMWDQVRSAPNQKWFIEKESEDRYFIMSTYGAQRRLDGDVTSQKGKSHPEPFLTSTSSPTTSDKWILKSGEELNEFIIVNAASNLVLDGNVVGVKEHYDPDHPAPFLWKEIPFAPNQVWIFESVSPKLSATSKKLINPKEHFSEQEISDYKKAFLNFDLNGDGVISVSELGNALRYLGKNPTHQEVQDMIRSVDVDGSGTLDFNEFLTLVAETEWPSSSSTQDEIMKAFKLFDKNGSGTITLDELKYFMTNMGERLSDEELEAMVELADVNGDGVIDYEEFAKILTS